MYGDHHRVCLGSALLLGSIFDLHPALPPASIADNRLHEPLVWRYAVLRDELVRSLRPRSIILSAGGLLLLDLLLFYELHLDRDSLLLPVAKCRCDIERFEKSAGDSESAQVPIEVCGWRIGYANLERCEQGPKSSAYIPRNAPYTQPAARGL